MSVLLRGGFRTEDVRLDRLPPPDWQHVEKYPLTAVPMAAYDPAPGVFGINWYRNFSKPIKKGRTYWIGLGDLGPLDGGHAIMAAAYRGKPEADSWYPFYDQGSEGACVGFSVSRLMSQFNRRRYDARWLYHEAQRIDPWEGGAYPGAVPFYEGSAVRSGFDVLRLQGHRIVVKGHPNPPIRPQEGIITNRWATTWDDVRQSLGIPDDVDGVPLLNSWGKSYPRVVRLADEAGARVLEREDGEFGTVTDRP
jgi:hypothetical protein